MKKVLCDNDQAVHLAAAVPYPGKATQISHKERRSTFKEKDKKNSKATDGCFSRTAEVTRLFKPVQQ